MEEWQNPETIVLWIIIAVVFLMLLLGFIVILIRLYFQKIIKTKLAESAAQIAHQENLIANSLQSQEKERERIAADLHDELINQLTRLKLTQEISNLSREKFIELIDESIATTRRISHDLSPPLLSYSSLSDIIKETVNPWKSKLTIDSKFDIRSTNDHSNEFKIHFIRILQEVMNNIEKHAQAHHLYIHYRQTNNCTTLFVKDDGVGYDSTTKQIGLGLKNMETRVKYLKGKYRFTSTPNHGTAALFIFLTK
jgi:signal transduction histidine kinase